MIEKYTIWNGLVTHKNGQKLENQFTINSEFYKCEDVEKEQARWIKDNIEVAHMNADLQEQITMLKEALFETKELWIIGLELLDEYEKEMNFVSFSAVHNPLGLIDEALKKLDENFNSK